MKTFTILKPDTLRAGNAGAIISRLEQEGFRIRAMKMKVSITCTKSGRFSLAL